MGTWEQGSFQNDGAMDWTIELSTHGIAAIRSAITIPAGYVQIDVAQAAIAAAELVAVLRGSASDALPEVVRTWVSSTTERILDEDVLSAIDSVIRVRDNSELREVWESGPRYALWLNEITTLLRRLDEVRLGVIAR
jgi:Domain of unknown function (DUF4259)